MAGLKRYLGAGRGRPTHDDDQDEGRPARERRGLRNGARPAEAADGFDHGSGGKRAGRRRHARDAATDDDPPVFRL